MKEKLYTIPVNDAFHTHCECPICAMYQALEENSIEFTMGPSYMEDDIRAETDRVGFCSKHIPMLYANQNRLGIALMLNTHMKKCITDLEQLTKHTQSGTHSIFKKKSAASPVSSYISAIKNSCFICNRIEELFMRYIYTIFYLYKNDDNFKQTFLQTKGFCLSHFELLYREAPNHLSGLALDNFLTSLSKLFLENMKRVQGDLEWFIDKFDYRYAKEPWKNSKDAIPRAILKLNSERIDL